MTNDIKTHRHTPSQYPYYYRFSLTDFSKVYKVNNIPAGKNYLYMKNLLLQPKPYSFTRNIENTFSLRVLQKTNSVKIKMMMLTDPINTTDYPNTFRILNNLLPSVLSTECFNDQNLPFYQEVKNTEIGHLFEHVLLEYMCQLKIAKGHKSAVYAGKTRWNWKRDPRGLFHININCPLKDADILPSAIKKSIALMKIIIQNKFTDPLPARQYLFYESGMPSMRTQALQAGLKNGKKLKKLPQYPNNK